jgi:sulfur carrier protein
MKVFIENKNKEVNIKPGRVADILESLEINPQTVIVIRNNEVVTEDEKLKESDIIKILSVISGG